MGENEVHLWCYRRVFTAPMAFTKACRHCEAVMERLMGAAEWAEKVQFIQACPIALPKHTR